MRHSYGTCLGRAYKAKAEGLELVRTLKPPYIVVGNHSTLLDPFLTSFFVPQPIHWVASDGNMRNPLMRFLLIKLAGSIPKSKAIPDIETVNWIVQFIRKKKAVVGIYPEGQSSWNGSSLPSFESTAKLLKLLTVPVVLALTKGAYMTKPRWGYTRREGRVEIVFSLLFRPEELKALYVGEIDRRLDAAIAHNDPAWAKAEGIRFLDPRRAECLELLLYACPACKALQSLESKGSRLICKTCGAKTEYGEDGTFGPPFPSGLKAWDSWQEAHLASLLAEKYLPDPSLTIFSDDDVILLAGKRMNTMRILGVGRLSLNSGGLEFLTRLGRILVFCREDIEGPGILKWNFFEFYVGKTVYRARFRDRAASGRKYAVALELLAKVAKTA
ncbi:MAG: lysophospholipid acyltransferase family protein [Spirochaetes bacterium]|nr:lysophospholipid acyltransferase family protein [Spirochaetota bacterium]